MHHQVFERIERQLLTPPGLHGWRDIRHLFERRIARVVQILYLVVVSALDAAAPAPERLALQHVRDHRGLALERDLGGRHLRRHHRDHVVGAEHAVDEVDERLPHRGGALELRVVRVEEDHEHAGPRIAGHLPALLDALRLDAKLLRDPGADPDVLEGLDLLGHAVFEDLDLVGLKSSMGLPSRVAYMSTRT